MLITWLQQTHILFPLSAKHDVYSYYPNAPEIDMGLLMFSSVFQTVYTHHQLQFYLMLDYASIGFYCSIAKGPYFFDPLF